MSNTPNTDSTLRKDRQNWAEVINAVNSILNIIDKEVPLSVEVRQKVNDDVDTVLLRLIALKVQEAYKKGFVDGGISVINGETNESN